MEQKKIEKIEKEAREFTNLFSSLQDRSQQRAIGYIEGLSAKDSKKSTS